MNDTRLAELVSTAGRTWGTVAPSRGALPPGCLSYARGRVLALQPHLRESGDRSHLQECPRCERLVRSFEQTLPHLSLWTLLRRRIGGLSAAERRMVEYHLDEGGCVSCLTRHGLVGALLPHLISIDGPRKMAHPGAVGAATATVSAVAGNDELDLVAELVEEGEVTTLEIRTKSGRWNHQLVGYTVRSADGQDAELGFLVLAPDVDGWYTATASFPARGLHRKLSGVLGGILIAPVRLDLLNADEADALVDAVREGRRDPRVAPRWAEWIFRREQDGRAGTGETEILNRVLEQLMKPRS